jgi:hypothetical protein
MDGKTVPVTHTACLPASPRHATATARPAAVLFILNQRDIRIINH